MSFFPVFKLDLFGGWWFSLLFLILHIILGLIFPELRKKALIPPKGKNPLQRLSMLGTFILFQSRIIMALFIPLSFRLPFFAIGAGFAGAALICYTVSLVTFISSPGDTPVTRGFYRLTRNPQQIFSILFWTGCGIMLGTALFPLLGLAEMLLAYPGFRAQEQFCLNRYGESYSEYMKKTPRYLMF